MKIFSHLLGNSSHADRSEVVDGESCIAGVVVRKESFEVGSEKVFLEAVLQFLHAHGLREILKEDFDENTTARSRFLLIQMNDRHDVPSNGIGANEMTEKSRNVSQSVCFVSMDSVIIFGEGILEKLGPKTIDLGKPLPDEAIEL